MIVDMDISTVGSKPRCTLRDSKQRFRSRRNEYIADLERSLRELRQQGLAFCMKSGTREFTPEAVASPLWGGWQCCRLLDPEEWQQCQWDHLLHKTFTRGTCADHIFYISMSVCVLLRPLHSLTTALDAKKQGDAYDTISDKLPLPQPAIRISDPKEVESAAQRLASTSCLQSRERHGTSPERVSISETSPPAPCKLIAHLAANPSADITTPIASQCVKK
jgi:hypothetical protein